MFTVRLQQVLSGCTDLWDAETFQFGTVIGSTCREFYQAVITWDWCAGHTVTGSYTVVWDMDGDGVYETFDLTSPPFSFTAGAGGGSWFEPSPAGPGANPANTVLIFKATFTLLLDGVTPLVLTWEDYTHTC